LGTRIELNQIGHNAKLEPKIKLNKVAKQNQNWNQESS